MQLTAEDKIRRARVQLQKDNPFFGYLVLHLELVEDEEKVPTAGVDFEGNLYYNPDFVNELSANEVKGLVCHEVMHLAIKGKMRMGARDKKKWNVAQDIVINHIVKQNGFDLPESALVPVGGNIEVGDVKITDIDDHSFESVYDVLPEQDGQGECNGNCEQGDGQGDGDGECTCNPQGFDDHIYEGDEDDDGSSGSKGGMDEEDWSRAMAKAQSHAKSQGKQPSAMGGRIEDVLEPSIDWRTELLEYISSEVISGYTWGRPHKRTRAVTQQGVNTTLPDTEKESLNVAVALDTSGSVSKEEIQQFLGEVCGILNAFEGVKLTLIKHTADVYEVEHYDSPEASQFAEIDVKSGGTNHIPVFKELEENAEVNPDLLINFTDGYTTAPENEPFGVQTVWAVDNHDIGMDRLNFGRILRIEGLMN